MLRGNLNKIRKRDRTELKAGGFDWVGLFRGFSKRNGTNETSTRN